MLFEMSCSKGRQTAGSRAGKGKVQGTTARRRHEGVGEMEHHACMPVNQHHPSRSEPGGTLPRPLSAGLAFVLSSVMLVTASGERERERERERDGYPLQKRAQRMHTLALVCTSIALSRIHC